MHIGATARASALASYVVTAFAAAFVLSTPAAAAEPPTCAQVEHPPSPEDAADLVELQPNAARPSLDLTVDSKGAAMEDIRFSPQERRRLGKDFKVTADLIEFPRSEGKRFSGTVDVGARTDSAGRTVVLTACANNGGTFEAGRFQGSVSLYGPSLTDFNYAVTLTDKWPAWPALLLLAVAIGVFLLVAWITGSFTFRIKGKPGRKIVAALLAVGFAIAAVVPTYFGTYVSNPAWGANPGAEIPALVAAGFTAAGGGLALAQRLLRPSKNGTDDGAPARR